MAQNTSNAVMAGRVEPADSLDYFPTPPWATRALCEHVLAGELAEPLGNLSAWEPACGEGHMARPLSEYFGTVIASDVHDYGVEGQEIFDFTLPLSWPMPPALATLAPDWIVTNPPFNAAATFADRALGRAGRGVALLVRTQWLHGAGRWREIFALWPPALVCPFVERVPMVKGRLDATVSSATDYCWFVWLIGAAGRPEIFWIPPSRKRLERPADYPAAAPAEEIALAPLFEEPAP